MNIVISVDVGSMVKFLAKYEEYKLFFEMDWLNRLDDEYRCRK